MLKLHRQNPWLLRQRTKSNPKSTKRLIRCFWPQLLSGVTWAKRSNLSQRSGINLSSRFIKKYNLTAPSFNRLSKNCKRYPFWRPLMKKLKKSIKLKDISTFLPLWSSSSLLTLWRKEISSYLRGKFLKMSLENAFRPFLNLLTFLTFFPMNLSLWILASSASNSWVLNKRYQILQITKSLRF